MTITAQQFTNARPEPERDRWGRPYVLTPGGRRTPYTRCTTFVGAIEDTFNVTRWKERHVAWGIATNQYLRDTVASLSVLDEAHKKSLDELTERAKEAAGASDSATWGTYMHAVTEAADTGRDPGAVPMPDLVHPREREAYLPDLAAYLQATDGLKHVAVEQFSVLDKYAIGGTPDRVVQLGGKRYIADLKTGRSLEYGGLKIAAQLAVYARSTPYDVTTDTRMPALGIDPNQGLVIHLPAGKGTCTLHWVDLSKGWDAVQLCARVREARKAKMRDLFTPYGGQPPAPAQRELLSLADSVVACTNAQQVRDLWAEHRDHWTDQLTDLAKAHIASLA